MSVLTFGEGGYSAGEQIQVLIHKSAKFYLSHTPAMYF